MEWMCSRIAAHFHSIFPTAIKWNFFVWEHGCFILSLLLFFFILHSLIAFRVYLNLCGSLYTVCVHLPSGVCMFHLKNAFTKSRSSNVDRAIDRESMGLPPLFRFKRLLHAARSMTLQFLIIARKFIFISRWPRVALKKLSLFHHFSLL